jgi:hypothetical protein
LAIVSIDEATQIDRSDEHLRNRDSLRIDSLQPGSNVKVESWRHDAKQDWEIVSIDEGMQIERSATQH